LLLEQFDETHQNSNPEGGRKEDEEDDEERQTGPGG
jgi:DnaJ family protein A protein 2